MFFQKILVALVGVLVLLPLNAEQTVRVEAVVQETEQGSPGNTLDSTFVDPAIAQHEEALRQRYEAARAKHQKRMEVFREQEKERAAQVEKWREARLEAYLKRREDRQQEIVRRHEAMRNRAEEEHNYLIMHHEEMLEQMLQSKIDFANRHENMRKQAEERRKKFAAYRATMKDMSAEERSDYMEEHREELFGSVGASQMSSMPPAHRYGAIHRSPPPPWYRPAAAR